MIRVSPDILTAGGTARVTFGPVAGAASPAVITISNGAGETTTLSIPLVGGTGSADWQVPSDWSFAYFKHPDSETVVRTIQQQGAAGL